MIRLARSTPLLVVAFSLLTSAAMVHAECAWVLWIKTTTGDDRGLFVNWQVRGDAAPGKPECEAGAQFIRDSQPKGVVRGMKGERISTGYFCLPTPWTRAGRG